MNIAATLTTLLDQFGLTQSIGNFIIDNDSKNQASLTALTTNHGLDTEQRYVLCMGHVINLVAQQILFRNDVDAFEPELVVTAEQLELQQ